MDPKKLPKREVSVFSGLTALPDQLVKGILFELVFYFMNFTCCVYRFNFATLSQRCFRYKSKLAVNRFMCDSACIPSNVSIKTETKPDDDYETYDPFPGLKIMRQYCSQDFKPKKSPDPKLCILEIVKLQLKVISLNCAIM